MRHILYLCLFWSGLASAPALAHPMPNSVIALDIGEQHICAEIAIPLVELDLARGTTLSRDPIGGVAAAKSELSTYLLHHIAALSTDAKSWTVVIEELHGILTVQTESGPYAEFVAKAVMTPPEGASTRSFTLRYDAVMHRVPTHFALVTVRHDWLTGRLNGVSLTPNDVGVLRINPVDGQAVPLEVNLASGAYWRGFVSMFSLGMSHIAEGTDHLLFLLMLLIPAPLLAKNGRWEGSKTARRSLLAIVKTVTGFTVGHSVALVFAAMTHIVLPQQPVEILIACTILISAAHAMRPLFPSREPVVATIFGLIHGMAFSFTLSPLDLSTSQLVVSVLGFNLGIECFQLLLVALALPSLLVFASREIYWPFRMTGAATGVILSQLWIADRSGISLGVIATLDDTGRFFPAALVLLAIAALVMAASTRRRQKP